MYCRFWFYWLFRWFYKNKAKKITWTKSISKNNPSSCIIFLCCFLSVYIIIKCFTTYDTIYRFCDKCWNIIYTNNDVYNRSNSKCCKLDWWIRWISIRSNINSFCILYAICKFYCWKYRSRSFSSSNCWSMFRFLRI